MITHKKRVLAASAACAVGLGLLTVPATAVAAEGDAALVNLIAFNDFHGRIEPSSGTQQDPTPRGGTVAFAGTIEQLRAEHGDDHSVLVSSGDNIGASLYASAVQQDAPTLEVLNALEVDAAAVGNHEFDRGIDDLQGRVRDAADFPHLAANVTLDGAPIGPAYELLEVDGITVAVIGAVTQETPSLVDPSGIEGVEFGDPVAAVNEVAAALSDGDEANGEADLIIASYHEGAQVSLAANAPQETQAAALQAAMASAETFRSIVEDTAPEVDAILNGHTHNLYSWLAPAPAGSQQDVRPILQGSSYGAHLSQLVAHVDRETGVATFDTVRNVARTTAPADDLIAQFPRVAAVDAINDRALATAAELGRVELGTIEADITTAYAGGSRDDRAKPSTMGTFVANMLRDQLASPLRGNAEIGITNPGGLRAELFRAAGEGESEDGIVTVGEAAAVLPFANNLWTADVTGAQLKTLLEQQWQRNAQGEVPSRPYLALGLSDNVEYTFDSTLAEGSRITGVWVDGEQVLADDTFRVAVPSFLLSGGDNFHVLRDATNKADSGLVDSEAFEAYIRAESPLTPDFSRRQLEVRDLPTAPVAVGQEISLQVLGTDLTSLGSPTATEIELWHGTERIATAPVQAGAATVVFDAPAAIGSARLELRTASGTAVPLSLPVDLAAERIAGENRFETAVALSQSAYADGADVVYVASGEVWPDALSAGPAAAHEDAPVLLVRKGEAPQVVLDEIERLGAERVVLVGGLPSIDAAVAAELAETGSVQTVDRVAGGNRFETSALIAEYAFDTADGAFVATGLRFADALSAGAAAGHVDQPLVLVDTRRPLPAALVETLEGLGAERARVIGSIDAVPSSIAAQLVDAGMTVSRLGGANRFHTSAIISASVFDAPVENAYLASGTLFPDALAAAAIGGAQGSPLLLVRPGCVDVRVLDEIERLGTSTVTIVGGEPSVGVVAASLRACA